MLNNRTNFYLISVKYQNSAIHGKQIPTIGLKVAHIVFFFF